MSDHLAQHRAEMERQAYPAVEHFIAQNPQYRIDPDQTGSRSVTNYVIFGQWGRQPIVFKYFCRDERHDREVFALHHFATTGLVPQLLADDGRRLIVQSRIPGSFLPLSEIDGAIPPEIDPILVGQTLGQATARLLQTPLSPAVAQAFESRFYDGETLPAYFDRILRASHSIQKQAPAYNAAIFADSLQMIEANLPIILEQKRLIYHQDAMNLHFAANRFTGFFDLEMCRIGVEAMQLGSLWYVIAMLDMWDAFVEGYVTETGRRLNAIDLAAGRAFAHFMVWRYISDYGDWSGQPLAGVTLDAQLAQAARYQQTIELYNRVISNH